MSLVDQGGMIGIRPLDGRARRFRAAGVERDGHDLEAFGVELSPQFLPHGQVETAASPRGPRDEQDLLPAQAGEPEGVAVDIRQFELRSLRGREGAALERLGPEGPEVVGFVGHEGQFPYRATIDWLNDAVPDAEVRRKIFGETALKLYFNGK